MGWTENSEIRHAFRAGGVALDFAWRDDRWVHEFGAEPGLMLPRAATVETHPHRADPARVVSPVYQQAHVETGADGSERMLMIGQSGPHHFSAAFTIRTDGHETTVDVDVADRCRSPIEAMAATYTVSPGEPPVDGDPERRFVWQSPAGRCSLEVEPPARLAIESAGYGNVLMAQVVAGLDPASHTQRFRYRWRWSIG